MDGYTTDYINLIIDNLRDRYDSGFPILKELLQNADDAKARNFIFARHSGFPDAVHPLLKGPGLWFFNDGEFKPSDVWALRSFGINSKAGDTAAIGKFGLGMKSVFHLCEAFFYLAWDGQEFHRNGLNPWRQEDRDPHPEWNHNHASDWDQLEALTKPLASASVASWFLLWVPLRREEHLINAFDKVIGPIIRRFAGDDDAHPDLKFLDDIHLPIDLAEFLPLLKHLERIEQQGEHHFFTLELKVDQRLLNNPAAECSNGQVTLRLGDSKQFMHFSGMKQEDQDPQGTFSGLKTRAEWPRSRYRDENWQEQENPDRTRPEAAVLFCRGPASKTLSKLHWAVFLPVEQGSEKLTLGTSSLGHALILHGQFFIDAGRKKPHALNDLHLPPASVGIKPIDDSLLRSTWNQHLAQRVLLPLVIPALEHYVAKSRLSNAESEALTQALKDSDWFRRFKSHICGVDAWFRTLESDAKPGWHRVSGLDRDRLRPLPIPPEIDPERPWQVFPRLKALGLLTYDASAPSLSNRYPQWQEAELDDLLGEVAGLFTDGPKMDYLFDLLEKCAGPFLKTERLQLRLIALFRTGLLAVGREALRQNAEKSRRLFEFVEIERRLALTVNLPDSVLQAIWKIETTLLLLPKLEPALIGYANPDDNTLRDWLQVLDHQLDKKLSDSNQQAILDASQGLLKALDGERRGRFLRIHDNLRIIAVRDAQTGKNRAVTGAEIRAVQAAGALFGFAQGIQERERMGLTPRLAAALPDSRIWLVRTESYRDLFPNEANLPNAKDEQALLAAIGRDESGRLGDIRVRCELLEQANDPGSDAVARRGLRYLLHGSKEHREFDNAPLWFPGHDQHPAWSKLWSQMYGADRWSLISNELANTVPRTRWTGLGVHEIDARSLMDKLTHTCADIPMPTDFSLAEREEILSKIEDWNLWQRLSLHTTVTGQLVSAHDAQVYLAPADETPHDSLAQEATLIAFSANPIVAAQQRRWLRPLDDRARIEIALRTVEPAQYWLTIMDAMGQLSANIRGELKPILHSSTWLPTRYGRPVKPEQVIDLTGRLADLAQRLVAEHRQICGGNFAVLGDFDERLRNHPAWDTVRNELFSSGEAGLVQLGQLLTQLPKYHIGNWPTNPSPEIIDLLAQCQPLPGWQLLQQASLELLDHETAWYRLGPGRLARPLTPDALFTVLRWITDDTVDWSTRKVICDSYLQQYMDANSEESVNLQGLRLANCRNQWRNVAELCKVTDGANIGIDPIYLLDSSQANFLVNSVSFTRKKTDQKLALDQEGIDYRFDQLYKNTPEVLKEYFAPWQQFVPSPMIGALLTLLGGMRLSDLASKYLEPYSFDWLVKQLDKGGDYDDIDEQLGKRRLAIKIINDTSVTVLNLLGDPIVVQLDQHPQTLFAGQLKKMGGIGVEIPLRKVDPADLKNEQRINLLFGTAESLCAEIYPPRRNLDHLRVQLDHTNQLEIQTAYRLILHDIPLYLRQLSIHHDGISKALRYHRRSLSELELEKNLYNQRKLEDSREALTQLIVEDNHAQQAVLNAVKAKLNDYQYDLSSIPFELFQNADDAAVELGEMLAVSTENRSIPEGARRLIVESNQTGIRILHWGRPVNARGPVVFDGARRGFDQDLEKMLLLSASDKQAEHGVTGKFGLGFKSVLLACDKPRILSGNLAVEVVAGILPTPWRNIAEAQNCLEKHASDARLRGTLIELPDISQQKRATILERFQRLAGIICVFGRAIRSISIVGEVESRFDWKAQPIAPEIEFGLINSGNALCIRTQNGSVLLAVGPEGIRPLPDEVPTLWLTAPTREQAKVGFAINGGFILDAGRGELATRADSGQKNHKLARQMGIQAGEAIGKLFERSRTDWPTLRQDLNSSADLDVHDFWRSLWRCLTEGWLGRIRHAAADLAREAAVALLKRLGERPQAIPNDLATPYRALVSAPEVRFELAKAFAVPEVIAVLGAWDRFVTKYPPNTLVSEDMGAVLKHIELAQPKLLGLAALVAVLDPPKVEPSDAGALGRLFIVTEEDKGWNAKEVRERLVRLQFRTEEGGWAVAGSLLANAGELIERDEALRYALAPPNRRLHRNYCVATSQDAKPSLEFFLSCRERLQAPAELLAIWILTAQTDESQLAALVYIADGDLGEVIAERVRDRDWLRGIFPNSSLLNRLSGEQCERLQRRLASSKVIEEGYKAVEPDYWSPQPPPPLIELEKALAKIHDWWACEGKVRAENYYAAFYPAMEIDLQIDPETGQFDRSSWLILFALGAFQNIGRTQDAQHRGFIQSCQQKGWWQTFATTDPKEHPEEWMDIIEQYAEGQHDEEQWTQWIAQFPKLYKLRRWMDDYVELFLSINHFDEPFLFQDVLTPRANRHYQGGGIDPPPLIRTLKLGGHLVIRELLRHRVIHNRLAIPHAYAPIDRIQRLFDPFNISIDSSQKIYKLLCTHLGEAQATFNGHYDIPLRIVAGDQELQNSLFR